MKNKAQYLNSKGKRQSNNQQKFFIPQKEKNFISKYKINCVKIQLAELSEKEFISKASEFYFDDLIYKQYFEEGELFSLNKTSSYKDIQKVNILLNELKQNDFGSPRVIFFQSPPMIGMSYIIRYFNNHGFKFMLFNNSFGKENNISFRKYLNREEFFSEDFKDGSILLPYQRIFAIMRNNYINNTKDSNNTTFFIIFKNLPYDLFLLALKKNNFTPNFIKNWEPTIMQFFKEIKYLLDKNDSNVKLIFFSDDKEIDEYELKTIFPKSIIEAPLTKNIICNPISKRKMTDILCNFLSSLNPKIINENDINSFIESIYLEFNSNIQQILDYLLLKITSEYYLYTREEKMSCQTIMFQKSQTDKRMINYLTEDKRSKNKTKNKLNRKIVKSNSKDFKIKKEKILDHDLFRLLGKLLYNKRYVVNKNSILKLKKQEFGNNLETPRYYDIDELINDIPISNNSFNDLLMYNTIDHFNDIKEYSDTYDIYSFTDTIDNFNSFLYDKNNQFYNNNNYNKLYLNCLGVTSYNLSQYNHINNNFNINASEKGLLIIRKPDIKIKQNMNKFIDKTYYNACEHYPSLLLLNLGDFYKEGYNVIYKLINMSIDGNTKNNIGNNKSYENINYYYREKATKKFFDSNEKENGNNNIKNDDDSPKVNKFRNIFEEDRKALESFFNENDDSDQSQTESDIEE